MRKFLLSLSTVLALSSTIHAQNVGIGTGSPGTKLHVAGGISSTPGTAAAAASVTIPDNTSVFYLTAAAGTQANALNMSSPTEGQLLTIYNEDGDAATFAGQSIAATSGVATFQYIHTGWRLVSTNQSSGGGGSYINNNTTQQTSANYNIDGNGFLSGAGSQATVGTGTANSSNGGYELTLLPNATRSSGINITMSSPSTTAYGLNISAGSASINGILSSNSTSSTTASVYTIGGVLSSTNIVSGYNSYRNGSGASYGIYGVNGTIATYATNANTWAAFLQGRTVISSESAPTSPVGTDLEVRNTTTGSAPATVSLRQTTAVSAINNVLSNLNFGDSYITGPQAQIQVLRDAAASSTSDMPTAMTFWTTADGGSTLSERMRIANNGNVGIATGTGVTPSYTLDVNGIVNTATGFKIAGGTPSTSTYLKGNGTNFVAGSILAADVPTLNQNTTGSAAGFTGSLSGDVTGTQSATVVGKINGVSMAGLGTGILKNTTGSGVPSIATSGTDYVAGGTGSSGQVAYFTGSGVINSSANNTFAVNPTGATALFVTNTSATISSAGILGTETGNGNVSGVQGTVTSTTTSASGVGGFANATTGTTNGVFGESFSSSGTGVYGVGASTIAAHFIVGVEGNSSGGGGTGAVNIGVYGISSGGTYNAGLYDAGGEVVIANTNTASSSALLTRSWSGSIFTQIASATTTGGRIWWSSGGYNFYVNSSGSADYSEFFYTGDQNLAVGEIVAVDPDRANGVRRARPSDAGKTVGIVSIGGTRYNDNEKGNRIDDPNYTNVGMLGQVPVLISTENGDIKPGDALTLSVKFRGRAVKATGPCRIIGYATTHFPYASGERDYETDINGGTALKLQGDHVMCYLNVGWYEPTNIALGDGEELPVAETAHAMMARINSSLVSPQKAEIEARDAQMKNRAQEQSSNPPAQAKPVQTPVKK